MSFPSPYSRRKVGSSLARQSQLANSVLCVQRGLSLPINNPVAIEVHSMIFWHMFKAMYPETDMRIELLFLNEFFHFNL